MNPSAHPLRAWIERHTTQREFARAVECSEPHLCDILAGRKLPSLMLAVRMSQTTDGAVPVESFLTYDAPALDPPEGFEVFEAAEIEREAQ